MSKHTPGEWKVMKRPQQGIIIEWGDDDKQIRPICHMRWTDGLRQDVEEAVMRDARLIASAPRLSKENKELKIINADLLEACKESSGAITAFIEYHKKDLRKIPNYVKLSKQLEQAISKAEAE